MTRHCHQGTLACEYLENRRLFAAGFLDTTFDDDGRVIAQVRPAFVVNDVASSVATQPDGKIVIAGWSDNGNRGLAGAPEIALIRLNRDGSFDESFGTHGKTVTAIGMVSVARAVAIQQDGKILVGGSSDDDPDSGRGPVFVLVRYNTDGTLDPTFDEDGVVTTPLGAVSDTARAIATQTDGKIVLAGESFDGANASFAIARYNIDGSLDQSFDADGKVLVQIGTGNSYGYSVALQADGKIVVGGRSFDATDHSDFALVRLNADGSIDSDFGIDGRVTTPIGESHDFLNSVAIQPDGKIVAVGASTDVGASFSGLAIARYDTKGDLDFTFDADGKLLPEFDTHHDIGYSVVIERDLKIIVAGSFDSAFALARYDAAGSLDPTFGDMGKVRTGFGFISVAYGVAIHDDGKVVAAGQTTAASGISRFAIAQYEGDAPQAIGIENVVVDEDSPPTAIDLYQVFEDATDPDSLLSFSIVNSPNSDLIESALIDQSGMLRLAFKADQSGSETITIRCTDSSGLFVDATFTVTVNSVNDAPIASEQSAFALEDAALPLMLVATDPKDPGDKVTYRIVSPPSHGTVTVDSMTGQAIYRPGLDYFGSDTFTFVGNDGLADSNHASVTIDIAPLNPSVTLDRGILTVIGSTGADAITLKRVGKRLQVLTSFAAPVVIGDRGAITGVLVRSRGDNDSINLSALGPLQSATVFGGRGDDSITSGAGHDILLGGNGDDRISSGRGDDLLIGGRGSDRLRASAGHDVLLADFLDDLTGELDLMSVLNDWRFALTVESRREAVQPIFDRALNDATRDILIGGSAPDLFLLGSSDRATGRQPEDVLAALPRNAKMGKNSTAR